jgi:hypothetical protein
MFRFQVGNQRLNESQVLDLLSVLPDHPSDSEADADSDDAETDGKKYTVYNFKLNRTTITY